MKLKLFFSILISFMYIIIFTSTSYANPIEVHSSVNKTPISKSIYILEDKTKHLTIDDIRSGEIDELFVQKSESIPNFGYTTSAYWTSFQLMNKTDSTELLFQIAYPPINDMEVFIYNQNGLRDNFNIGAKYPFNDRPINSPDFSFLFDMNKGEALTFYIRFETDGSMQMPMYVWEKDAFTKKRQFDFLQMGIFYGVIGIMVIYNLFLYFALRHRSFLYYIFLILCVGFINLSLSGIAYKYIWPESPWWNMRSIVFFLSLGGIFALFFTKSFLHIEEHLPKVKNIFYVFFGLNTFNLLLVFISYKLALNLMVVSITGMILFILFVAFECWKRGARQARFFIIGWFVFLIGSMLSILADSAVIPINDFTRNVWHYSFLLEVILLSLALADRINILQNEKNQAVLKAHESQQLAVENLKRSDVLKDEFLAITSHELRTPLYGMIGIAESLKDGVTGKLKIETSDQLELIIMSGKRLMDLVNNLLDLSKLKHGAMEIMLQKVHLKELVSVVIAICQPLLKSKSVLLVNEVDEELPSIMSDQNHLMQIFYNLIGNAIKFTESGSITIKATRLNGELFIQVTDTGRGMTHAQMTSIFEPFHQSADPMSRDRGGTGIGLNITKQLINLHGGEIAVDSVFGKGTTFTFNLPLKEAVFENDESVNSEFDVSIYVENDDAAPKAFHNKPDKHHQGKILVADDENVNLQVLVNHLSMEGFEVVTAYNGEQALELIDEDVFDIIILDVMMPTMSGFEVCSRLREKFTLTELPVLMLTANSQLQDKLVAFQVGANDYLSKPCDKEELLARVNTLIALRKLTRETEMLTTTLEEKVKHRTTELREVNKDLERVNNELRNMEDSRTELLSNITHELGTPITLIQSYVEAVNEGLVERDNPRYLSIIHEKLIMLEHLTRDLFELAKMKSGQMKYEFNFININYWYKTIVQLFEYDVNQSGRNFKHNPLEVPTVLEEYGSIYMDRIRMEQVFTNIIRNAVNYTDEDTGIIELQIRVSENINESNLIASHSNRLRLIIEIIDNGKGISDEDLPHIFERYFRGNELRNVTAGSGLGLAICNEIIQAHCGEIFVTSTKNEGSHFRIELPLYIKKNKEGVH